MHPVVCEAYILICRIESSFYRAENSFFKVPLAKAKNPPNTSVVGGYIASKRIVLLIDHFFSAIAAWAAARRAMGTLKGEQDT